MLILVSDIAALERSVRELRQNLFYEIFRRRFECRRGFCGDVYLVTCALYFVVAVLKIRNVDVSVSVCRADEYLLCRGIVLSGEVGFYFGVVIAEVGKGVLYLL